MNRQFKLYSLICVLLLSVAGCDMDRKVTRNEAVIAVIGDSIANGHNLATPWPTLLSKELQKPVHNTSISGMETGWGLEVIDGVLETQKPTHLLISLGTNDATRGPSLEVAIANLQEMVRRANEKGATVLVGNIIPNLLSKEADARSLVINEGIAKISGITLVDNRSEMLPEAKSLFADGVHPNQHGQQIIAETFLRALNSSFAPE